MPRRLPAMSFFAVIAIAAASAGILLSPGASSPDQLFSSVSVGSPAGVLALPPAASEAPAQQTLPGPSSSASLVDGARGPYRLEIPRLGIDAPTVVLGIDANGAMQAPARPTDVAWYSFSSQPGQGGNIVMAGHVDYANYGPAVFWTLRDARAGDSVQIVLPDGSVANYRVMDVESYDADAAPVAEIVGATAQETLTLITCSGSFDSASRHYDKRLVVRAVRTS